MQLIDWNMPNLADNLSIISLELLMDCSSAVKVLKFFSSRGTIRWSLWIPLRGHFLHTISLSWMHHSLRVFPCSWHLFFPSSEEMLKVVVVESDEESKELLLEDDTNKILDLSNLWILVAGTEYAVHSWAGVLDREGTSESVEWCSETPVFSAFQFSLHNWNTESTSLTPASWQRCSSRN